MLHSAHQMNGVRLDAKDGEVGKIKDCYFDDQKWVIRYLVVDTGGWLTRRLGLISPISVTGFEPDDRLVRVDLTREQVEHSPDIDTERPVARQHEISFLDYYHYPYYWYGPLPWGLVAIPSEIAPVASERALPAEVRERVEQEKQSGASNLRSAAEVRGYVFHARDGSIGEVEDLLFDDRGWAVRYLVVDTRKWLPGRRVLIDPQWIERIEWPAGEVYVNATRQAVESSPEYDPSMTLSSDYEERLRRHYIESERTLHE